MKDLLCSKFKGQSATDTGSGRKTRQAICLLIYLALLYEINFWLAAGQFTSTFAAGEVGGLLLAVALPHSVFSPLVSVGVSLL
jgi:hypothetical protein